MTALVKRCAEAGLAGFDWAISIPGTVGGAVWANAGAHGGEMARGVRDVEVLDAVGETRRVFRRRECGFAYRESRFKHGDEVVLAATIGCGRGDPDAIRALVDAHQAQRGATQPLADQNAGSVFRNPPGDHAGRLIEAAGLKGHRLGTRARQRAARELHRHRSRRPRGRTSAPSAITCARRSRNGSASSSGTRSSSSATGRRGTGMSRVCGSASSPAAARPSTR